MTYESDQNLEDEKPEEEDEGQNLPTVATSANLENPEDLSKAPTDALQAEYKKLMDQYEIEMNQRKALEEEIE